MLRQLLASRRKQFVLGTCVTILVGMTAASFVGIRNRSIQNRNLVETMEETQSGEFNDVRHEYDVISGDVLNSMWGYSGKDSLASLNSITEVTWHSGVRDEHLKLLAGYKLRYLSLNIANLTADGLKQLQELHELDSLQLRGRPARAAELSALGGIQGLKSLSVVNVLNDDGMAAISRLESVEKLRLVLGENRSHVTDTGIAHLAQMKQLKELLLEDRTNSTGAGLAAFVNLLNLSKLELRKPELTSQGWEALASITQIDQLKLLPLPLNYDQPLVKPNARMDEVDISGLQNLSQPLILQLQWIADDRLSDETIMALGKCRKIRELWLDTRRISSDALQQFLHTSEAVVNGSRSVEEIKAQERVPP